MIEQGISDGERETRLDGRRRTEVNRTCRIIIVSLILKWDILTPQPERGILAIIRPEGLGVVERIPRILRYVMCVRISSLSASFSHTPFDVPPSFRDVIDSFSRLIATAETEAVEYTELRWWHHPWREREREEEAMSI